MRKMFLIMSAPLVDWLHSQKFPMPQPPIRFYPDGSLWTDDERSLAWKNDQKGVVQSVHQLIHQKLPGAYAVSSFRPLAPFCRDGCAFYSMTYPGSYAWALSEFDELGLRLWPGDLSDVSQQEYDLSHLRVLVRSYLKMTLKNAEQIADALRIWFNEIGSKGVFGEAGVYSISRTLQYQGHNAGFELDAHTSGQETLNTLYLALLGWATERRQPISMIHLAADHNERVFTSKQTVPFG